MAKVSMICSTYNSPKVLEIILASISQQTFQDFELIIADDGSQNETKELIESFTSTVKFPVKHCWHEDQGFRKSKIHNEAIRQATGDLLVFTDGDCILAPNFLTNHFSIYEKYKNQKFVLMGRRVELGREYTSRVTKDNFTKLLFSPFNFSLFISEFKGDSQKVLRKYWVKNKLLRKVLKADGVVDLLGCNFSLKKSVMLEINGFNESFEGFGSEDYDIFLRLKNIGCELIGKKYFAVQYHLYHKRLEVNPENVEYYEKKLKDNNYKWAENGLTKQS